jgi:hypothetical protein
MKHVDNLAPTLDESWMTTTQISDDRDRPTLLPMRYVIFVIDQPNNHGNPDEMRAIDAFNEQLRINGYWIMAAGIGDPTTATLIDNRDDKGGVDVGSLFDGPEHYSGFWIIETPSHEVALALAAQGSKACHRKVELRPFLGNQ